MTVDALPHDFPGAAAEAVARRSYGKLVAYLARRMRDVAGAEDALADAFVAALSTWPRKGVPDDPEAWLMTVARRRLIDAARRGRSRAAADGHLRLMQEELEAALAGGAGIPDERLALMFACAHPAIDPAMRTPLVLQTVLGLEAATIASAFLVSPSAMAQRLVRAKAKIREAGIPFRVPDRDELPERLDVVLAAIYAAYAEGWSDPAGTDARRRNLAGEAIWLGRLVAELLPGEPEAAGLVALMLFAESRREARRDAAGDYVPLGWQDRSRWDGAMIEAAEAELMRASRAGRIGRYQIEAAIQSAHVVGRVTGHSDWAAIEQLYDVLVRLTGSPVAAINRCVAIAETRGPEAALTALDEIAADARLEAYQPYWVARADCLARTGERATAREAYQRAIGLETDPVVRRFLQERKDAL